jgi:hypothetical protein
MRLGLVTLVIATLAIGCVAPAPVDPLALDFPTLTLDDPVRTSAPLLYSGNFSLPIPLILGVVYDPSTEWQCGGALPLESPEEPRFFTLILANDPDANWIQTRSATATQRLEESGLGSRGWRPFLWIQD